jgi:hypothetical protein
MQKSYLVWNPERIENSSCNSYVHSLDTLEGLQEAEHRTGDTLSLMVTSSTIEQIVTLARDECNSMLKYAEIEIEKTLVAIFSLGDYADYNEARSCGAVTYLQRVDTTELELIKHTFKMTSKSFGDESRVIGTVANNNFTEL